MVQLRLENLLRTDALPSALSSEPWEKQEDPRVCWDEGSGSEGNPLKQGCQVEAQITHRTASRVDSDLCCTDKGQALDSASPPRTDVEPALRRGPPGPMLVLEANNPAHCKESGINHFFPIWDWARWELEIWTAGGSFLLWEEVRRKGVY